MQNSSEDPELRKVIGLGERSYRKTYYPELKRRMQELERGRELLETTIDTAPVPIAFIDDRQRYLFANQAYAERLRMQKKELRGRTIREVLGEENYAAVAPRLEAAYAGERQMFPLERQVPGSDGPRSYIVAYAPHINQEGQVRGIVIAISDVTEMKEAAAELLEKEAEVARSRDLLQAIIDSAPIPIAYLDENARYIIANGAYLEMLGLREEEVIGKEIHEVMSVENFAQVEAYCHQAAVGTNVRFPLSWTMPNGDHRFYIKRCAPDRDDKGRIHGIISTLNEVTDLKEAEASLIAAKEEAEAANHSKSEFLANMSHEMRTPLAGVLGMVNLVLQMQIGEEERSLLEMAQRSGDSLLRLISDLLDFSRIEAGKMNFETRSFSLRGCIKSAMEVIAIEAQRKGLVMTCDIDPLLTETIQGDEGRLRQVLVNLIGNAVKFTKEGGVFVTASTEVGDTFVVFAVSDTGIGIPQEKMDLLFREFSQLDASTTKRYGGTGLGLALSSQIVAKVGGKMWVESEQGRGSTFYFTWPLQRGAGIC